MKISNRAACIALAVIMITSLFVSTLYIGTKQGYHEDEILTYSLANSSKQLNVDGGWNSPEDFNEYLTVADDSRFNYAQVIENQVIDASHPPFYYALVHTVCSFFPGEFSPYFAYSVNVLAMIGVMIMLFLIGKRVSGNNFFALTAAAAYALSIAGFTTTIYLRMYATLTFFVCWFVYNMLRLYDKKGEVKLYDCLILTVNVTFGVLTQYYFIFYAGITGLIYLIFKIKEKNIKDLLLTLAACAVGFGIAMAIYPHIISNVLGGNRGFGSLSMDIDFITIVTYLGYKLLTYVHILAKELFLGQLWLLAACTVVLGLFFWIRRFRKGEKLSPKAVMIAVPAVGFFIGISLLSPFNSDRYVMASLPFLTMCFVFGFFKLIGDYPKTKKLLPAVPAGVLAVCVLGVILVRPYYLYGKTNLYDIKDKNCVFVGTAMLEWTKCIDKLMNYDSAMIVQTSEMDPHLGEDLDDFAQKRGVVTNGKISEFASAFMNNGSEKELTSSMDKLKTDEKLSKLDSVTVYISRLTDTKSVIRYITENTDFKKYELIQPDYSFEDFYNWYDYFVETESYSNVYRFSK